MLNMTVGTSFRISLYWIIRESENSLTFSLIEAVKHSSVKGFNIYFDVLRCGSQLE